MKISPLGQLAQVRTAVVFRNHPPQEVEDGNVRALAIRDVVADRPLQLHALPQISIDENLLLHCLQPDDVVMPSRGDYYTALHYDGPGCSVFPLGQLNVISVGPEVDAGYLAWYLNRRSVQAKINAMLTGTSIKAFTKSALLTLEVEVPHLRKQKLIAELDRTNQEINATRHRLNELDTAEVTHLTEMFLRNGECHA